MPGMQRVPEGTYRKPGDDQHPPVWWKHYYRDPDTKQDVHLGDSERLQKHLHHRFYPADNSWPEVKKGFIAGVRWLLSLYLSGKDRNEGVTMAETEEVREE